MPTNRSHAPELIAPVASFFTHETVDPRAVARCFTADGAVLDEGREHHGRAAIAAWNAAAVARYELTTEPLTAETVGEGTTVSVRVSGRFPGSPATLRYRFTVEGDLIARLEIGQ